MNLEKDNFYFIAEIGVNHEGNIEKAFQMVEEVADAGAHAAKFQAYKAEKLVVKSAKAYWDTSYETETSQLALFKKYDSFGAREYSLIQEKCQQCGIDFMATPFDLEAVEMINELSNVFKIASADLTNKPLLEAIAKKEKDVILSTGASSYDEIEIALNTLKQNGSKSIALLHCVLNYPCKISNSYLSHILNLKEKFENDMVTIGYSDHIPSSEANDDQLIIALSMGCRVFERHYTHDTSLEGNDHYHALDKNSLKNIINRIKGVLPSIQECDENHVLSKQSEARDQARRSLVTKHSLQVGHVLQKDDLICKRPGTGISPTMIEDFVGKKIGTDVEEDTILKHEHFIKE